MLRSRRSTHLAPGSAFLAGLLLLLLGLSTVLAYQAADAARSEARASERALHGYATFATWELARHADEALHHRLAPPLARPAPPESIAAAASANAAAWCRCADPVRGAFVARWKGGAATLDVSGAPLPVEASLRVGAAWTLLERAAAAGGAAGDTVRVEGFEAGGVRYDLVSRLTEAEGERRIDGYAVVAAAVVEPAFAEAFRTAALLPGSAHGARPAPDAVVAVVAAPDERVLWRSDREPGAGSRDGWVDAKVGGYPPEPLARGMATERLDGLFTGLTARVAVRAEAAGAPPPDAPSSRLPLLLLVFGLTLALVAVAIVQLRRQQELVRLRDDFVSGVSHELRTPLAQIRLFSELLESGRLPAAEQRTRSIGIISEESRRLAWLVENILHFSRAQRGTGRVAPEAVEAAPLVRSIVDAYAPLARTRDVRFEVRADEGVVARIDADALRQVLLNLLDNAVKYGPPGQTVRVRAELRGVRLRISVDDQGPGVPWDDRNRVWEPYRRLTRDAEGATGGCGIGLAVVKDLVELHGGRAGVGEAPGGGARFWVEFPYAMHAGPTPLPAPAPEPAEVAG